VRLRYANAWHTWGRNHPAVRSDPTDEAVTLWISVRERWRRPRKLVGHPHGAAHADHLAHHLRRAHLGPLGRTCRSPSPHEPRSDASDGRTQPGPELAVNANSPSNPSAAATPERLPTPFEASLPPAVRRWLVLAPRAPSLEVLIEEALSRPT
jgi:hypothetical protein